MTATLDRFESLESYVLGLGKTLAGRLDETLAPLHRPGVDPPDPLLANLVRPPLAAQADVATALRKALDRQKAALMIGEMGVGKSMLACSAAYLHARGRPFRALVMAPDHLLGKWAEEVEQTVPGATAGVLESWRDVAALDRLRYLDDRGRARWRKPERPEWYIIGRDRAKAEPARRPAAGRYLSIPEGGRGGRKAASRFHGCPACAAQPLDRSGAPIPPGDWGKKRLLCTECGAALWQFDHRATKARDRRAGHPDLPRGLDEPARTAGLSRMAPWRYAPDKLIHKRLNGLFDYFILDEIHECKSESSEQGNASGTLAAACGRTIGLTGTLLGGYAWHLFPLLWRLAPGTVKALGFEWGKSMPFSERYGRIEEVTVTTTPAEQVRADRLSHGRGGGAAGAEVKRRRHVRPGIMPALFADTLMGQAVYLSLDECSEALPPRPLDEVLPCAMDPELAGAYRRVESAIGDTIRPMIARGDMTLLAKMLVATLGYPDMPHGWGDFLVDFGLAPGPELDPGPIRPKERALLDLCLAERDAGRQVWVGVMMTGVRDVEGRLERLLREAGLRAGTLRASVDRAARRDWIINEGAKLDVALSHPELVKTGLDLFDKRPGGANYATICAFSPSYNIFTTRQFVRRAWRIGQTKPCRIAHLYYQGTMQERAIALVGRKLAAAEALDGKFSAEGLAAMAGDANAELALARSLSETMESAERVWARVSTYRAPEDARAAIVAAAAGAALAEAAGEPGLAGPIARLAEPLVRKAGSRRRRDRPGQLSMFD